MDKYQCSVCGTIYDPAKGTPARNIPPGTPFADLPSDWQCPVCGSSKDKLQKMEQPSCAAEVEVKIWC